MLRYMHAAMRAKKEEGASAVEYGLMVAAIAAVIVLVVFALGGVVKNIFSNSCTKINNGNTAASAPASGGAAPNCAGTEDTGTGTGN